MASAPPADLLEVIGAGIGHVVVTRAAADVIAPGGGPNHPSARRVYQPAAAPLRNGC